jgi:TPR repeat protein
MGERVGVEKDGAIASVLIGLLYALGRGVPQDTEEARRWFQMEPEHRITPRSASWIASRLYADRFYTEDCYWLIQSTSRQLPVELLELVERKRNALEEKISPLKRREIQARITDRRREATAKS